MSTRDSSVAMRLIPLLVAQSLAGVLAQQTPPVFRGSTTLIPLDVRVVDKDGRPVTDLTDKDFTILEDGVQQEVSQFARQGLVAEPAGVGQSVERRLTLTNQTLTPDHRRVYLLFLGRGDLNGPSHGVDGLIHLVRDRLLPQDYVAILAWNRATDFTTDHASALEVLQRFKTGYRRIEQDLRMHYSGRDYFYSDPVKKRTLPPAIQREIDLVFGGPAGDRMRSVNYQLGVSADTERDLLESGELFDRPFVTNEFDQQRMASAGSNLEQFLQDSAELYHELANLNASIEYMRHLDGEKHVVWLTEYGLKVDLTKPTELERDVARRAADARVVLDVIRAGGTQTAGGIAEARSSLPNAAPNGLLLPAAASRTLAALTGGRSDANRFPNASIAADYIDQASRFQYLLGYSPTNPRWDGRFRTVQVTVARRGVTVFVRGGYYAREEIGPLDRQGVVTFSRIVAAAADGLEISDLPLRAAAASARDGRSITLNATLDIGRVIFNRGNERNTATLEVAVYVLDKKQHGVGDIRNTIELTYSDERLAEARRDGVPVTLTVPTTGPATSLKLVVYNFAADLTGTLNVVVTSQ